MGTDKTRHDTACKSLFADCLHVWCEAYCTPRHNDRLNLLYLLRDPYAACLPVYLSHMPYKLARTLCTPTLLASSRFWIKVLKSALDNFLPPAPSAPPEPRFRDRSRRASGPMMKR